MRLKLGFTAIVVLLSGCAKSAQPTAADLAKNLVTSGGTAVNTLVSDEGRTFRVMAKGALVAQAAQKKIALIGSAEAKRFLEEITGPEGVSPAPVATTTPVTAPVAAAEDPTALVVGLPVGLLNEQYVFDGVITAVSDAKTSDLGNLKLTDLNPIHVKLALVRDPAPAGAPGAQAQAQDGAHIAILGCANKCIETSPLVGLQDLPVVGVDTVNKLLLVDLAAVSKDLDLLSILDSDGSGTHLKTIGTKTLAFDYSLSTLVFDVQSRMIPLGAKEGDAGVTETVFTTRWFLRLSSAFNPAFHARPATDGVGFFTTSRSADTQITRWSVTSAEGAKPVHYYIKNVPERYQAAFKSAFDEWNSVFKEVVGKDVFAYTIVPVGDPRNELLVTGDPRFNIVEWDLKNIASYGGLGPSMANQFTGENISANVFIQGPTIEGLYKNWFKVNEQARALREAGQARAATELLAQSRRELLSQLDGQADGARLDLTMRGVHFRINSQRPELNDPVAQRNDFDPLPAGLTYDQYMFGYFHDMLTHELGHNLGLRHNFKGNLGSTGDVEGGVSRSIMEYLGRPYRYLDHAGEYDVMAVRYGYSGTLPTHTDWFCTDEDGVDGDPVNHSAECTSNDATADPFGWFQMRLDRAINDLVAPGDAGEPTWTVVELARELGIAIKGIGAYASSAEKTSSTWVKFFTGGDRPANGAGVKAYVIAKLKAQVCNPALDVEAKTKSTPAAQEKTATNLRELRAKVVELITAQKTITAEELSCQ